MKRRDFLRLSLLSPLSIWWSSLFASVTGNASDGVHQRATLKTYIDILIPEDITPAASQLGIHDEIIARTIKLKAYRRLLQYGVIWLDKTASSQFAQQPFILLSPGQQETIITAMESAKRSSAPRLFFEQIRKDCFDFYYTKPESWGGLGFNNPPQPLGNINYSQPPASKSI